MLVMPAISYEAMDACGCPMSVLLHVHELPFHTPKRIAQTVWWYRLTGYPMAILPAADPAGQEPRQIHRATAEPATRPRHRANAHPLPAGRRQGLCRFRAVCTIVP